ncbi:hypothetical protein B0I37DRAFT_336778 [Chaetomium sp. MPI-CAGE-AT-0009]|nr:hypothetical protein B0I37DRAFT_336778 [Chaetomium sp. MPI-CAGE-AT-0009]
MPGDLVAVCLPRGGDLLAALLGVWLAEAAYVPLDPAYPTAYSRQILDDAGPSTVVCDARTQTLLGVDDSRCLRLEQIPDVTDVPREQPEPAHLEQKVSDELKAVFHPCRAVAPGMVQRGSGSIIALSSTLSKRSNAGFLAQSTAKAAVDAFVRSLAAELGPHGIRANTVAPGVTLTDAALPMAPHVKESVAAICPMRRNGLPEDMAGAVLFLASDLSRFMTGTYLPIDGGFTTL